MQRRCRPQPAVGHWGWLERGLHFISRSKHLNILYHLYQPLYQLYQPLYHILFHPRLKHFWFCELWGALHVPKYATTGRSSRRPLLHNKLHRVSHCIEAVWRRLERALKVKQRQLAEVKDDVRGLVGGWGLQRLDWLSGTLFIRTTIDTLLLELFMRTTIDTFLHNHVSFRYAR